MYLQLLISQPKPGLIPVIYTIDYLCLHKHQLICELSMFIYRDIVIIIISVQLTLVLNVILPLYFCYNKSH